MLTPLASGDWNYAKAAHLLNRATFGGAPADIEAAREKGLPKLLSELTDAGAANPSMAAEAVTETVTAKDGMILDRWLKAPSELELGHKFSSLPIIG